VEGPAAGEAIGQAPQNKSHPFRLASGRAFFFGLSYTLKEPADCRRDALPFFNPAMSAAFILPSDLLNWLNNYTLEGSPSRDLEKIAHG
jgi:hypothetical protein